MRKLVYFENWNDLFLIEIEFVDGKWFYIRKLGVWKIKKL